MADEGGRMKEESRRLSGQKPLHLSAFILYSSRGAEYFARGEASILRGGETILRGGIILPRGEPLSTAA
jgi:hypothetical protein